MQTFILAVSGMKRLGSVTVSIAANAAFSADGTRNKASNRVTVFYGIGRRLG